MPQQLKPELCQKSLLLITKFVIIFALAFSILTEMAGATETDERLLRVSIELFPAVLAADQNIIHKQNNDAALAVALVYDNDELAAKNLAKQLSKVKILKTLPFQVKVVTIKALTNDFSSRLAGVFLTQQLETKDLISAINYGIKHQTLVFSPFESDISQGITVGITFRDRILPYINSLALNKAQLQLNPLFLRISKHYGE